MRWMRWMRWMSLDPTDEVVSCRVVSACKPSPPSSCAHPVLWVPSISPPPFHPDFLGSKYSGCEPITAPHRQSNPLSISLDTLMNQAIPISTAPPSFSVFTVPKGRTNRTSVL
jgi:hypothetical protein